MCGVFLVLLFHARTSAKAAGGKRQRRATAPSGAEPCKSAKSAAQLIKRARKLRSGDPEAALACLEVGAHRFAQSGELWEEHGALLEDMGKPHDALEMFERAIALSPSLGLAALRLGNIYASHQDDARAIELFQKASKARPDSPVPYNNIGLAHMRNGRVKEAHEIFRRGLDSTPEGAFGRSMILNNLGLLLKEQGDVESAAQYFQQALELEASVEAASNLSALLIQAGNYEQAWAVCSAMIAGKQGSLNAQLAEIGVVSLTLLDRMQVRVYVPCACKTARVHSSTYALFAWCIDKFSHLHLHLHVILTCPYTRMHTCSAGRHAGGSAAHAPGWGKWSRRLCSAGRSNGQACCPRPAHGCA